MIYLDNAATTKISPEVLEKMMPYLTDSYGNPGGIYKFGREAMSAVNKAREQVASFMHTTPEHIIFTSGGSEGNSLILNSFQGKKILSSSIEHDSIYNYLIQYGCIGIVNPNNSGEIKAESVLDCISNIKIYPDLISIMYVNNETGIKNDIKRISNCVKEKYPLCLFHSDCVQAAGNYDIDVDYMGIDFATISSHKIHGPKGVGAIYVRNKNLVKALVTGGKDQEYGLRGGTENVAGIVGFGEACQIALKDINTVQKQYQELRKLFIHLLEVNCGEDNIHVNGASCDCSKALNVQIKGIDTQSLILMLDDDVCISAGSACNSRSTTPSRVLLQMGISQDECLESFRVSFSKYTTKEDVENAVLEIANAVNRIKTMI